MSITCDRLQDQYSDYFEHTLPHAQVVDFESHLATCDKCRSDYHVFATMFQFLDRIDVTEVEAPTTLRADILAEISQRPEVKAPIAPGFLTVVLGSTQFRYGAALAAAAAVVIAAVVVLHPTHVAQNPGAIEGNVGGIEQTPSGPPPMTPLVQNVVLKQNSDANYEVFTLHTPSSLNVAANVSAYVLQDGDPLADSAMEANADKATPAWSGSIEPNVSVSLPVTVTSSVNAGATLNLLLDWSAQDNSASGREAAFVPISAAPYTTAPVAAGTSFYDAVSQIAGEYQQTVVADTSALNALVKTSTVSATTGNEINAEDALDDALGSDGFTVTEQPGGYYKISHP